jgi:hypothetical protein
LVDLQETQTTLHVHATEQQSRLYVSRTKSGVVYSYIFL